MARAYHHHIRAQLEAAIDCERSDWPLDRDFDIARHSLQTLGDVGFEELIHGEQPGGTGGACTRRGRTSVIGNDQFQDADQRRDVCVPAVQNEPP